jgi:hypothetical protein
VALALFYYLVPDIMLELGPLEVHRNYVLLLLFLIIAFMELLRLLRLWNMRFFRDYENHRISAPFWFSSTAALLILLTPQWFAVPCILSVTFADPVIGELRMNNIKAYPVVGWFICLCVFIIFSYPLVTAVILAGAATFVEIIEIPIKNKRSALYGTGIVDDNFLMQFAPALLILLFWFISNSYDINWLLPEAEALLTPIY